MSFTDLDKTKHKYESNSNYKLEKVPLDLDHNPGSVFEDAKTNALRVNIIIVSEHLISELFTFNLTPIDPKKMLFLFNN